LTIGVISKILGNCNQTCMKPKDIEHRPQKPSPPNLAMSLSLSANFHRHVLDHGYDLIYI
jgi:hypothetical protein